MKTNHFWGALRPIIRGVAGLSLVAMGGAASAQYVLTELPTLEGFANVYATGLNASGQVVGYGYNGTPLGKVGSADSGQGLAFVTGAGGQGIQAIAPLAGSAWSRASGINDAGQVIGSSGNSYLDTQAFIADGPAVTARAIGGHSATYSDAAAINASGQVVGLLGDPSGNTRAFLSTPSGSTAVLVDQPGSALMSYQRAFDVTDDGRVIGSYDAFGGVGRAFVTAPGGHGAQELLVEHPDLASATSIMASRINEAGQIAGTYLQSGGGAFLRDADGSVHLLDFSNASQYVAGNLGSHGQSGPRTTVIVNGLNAAGQVAGTLYSNTSWGASWGYITGPNGQDLVQVDDLSFENVAGPLDFYFTSVTGINDLGSFVANGSNGRAYLISVVPEPATVYSMLGGLLMLGAAVRHQRRRA